MSTDPIAPPATPPSDRSTVKWSFTYESSTGADFAKTQSEIGLSGIDSLLTKLVEVFANTRTPPIVGRLQPQPPPPDNVLPFPAGWSDDDETMADILEGLDHVSTPLQRRVDHLRQTRGTVAAIEALVGEFVLRFDDVYERDDRAHEISVISLILKFFQTYGITQEDPYVADLVAQIHRMNYEEREAWMNQLLKGMFPGDRLRAAIREGLHGLPTSTL